MSQYFSPFSKEAQTARSPGGKGKMSERRDGKPPQYKEESDEVVNCKRKGNAYEGYIARILKQWFPNRNIRRTGVIQTIKAHGTGDILGWPNVHPEVKDCKALSMFEWLRTMVEVCQQTGDMPVLFFHQPASKGFKNKDDDWMVCRVGDFPFLAMDFAEQQREAG